MEDSVAESEMEVNSVSSSYSSSIQVETSQSQVTLETGPVDENANAIEDTNAIVNESAEISQDNIKTQLQEIISEIEQNVGPEDEEEVTKEQEDAVKSLVEQELKLMQEEEALLAQQSYMDYEESDQPYHHTWTPKGKYDKIKTEVKYEDINPIKVDDPKLTELQHAAAVAAAAAEAQSAEGAQPEQNGLPVDTQPLINGFSDEMEGLDIPAGIPLLARILPKDDETGERKISLERLFTPATDSPDLTPTRNKKIFASSDFYRADHPTIDDQRDLAQRISNSLVVEDNKMSRGQSMYIKRKERSEKWTGKEKGVEYQFQSQYGRTEVSETDFRSSLRHVENTPSMPVSVPVVEKPTLRPIPIEPIFPTMPAPVAEMPTLRPVETAPPVPVTTPVVERPTLRPADNRDSLRLTMKQIDQVCAEIESPSGRGAELFAKRKKRMDKYIVDETTVQKSSFAQQQSSVVSSNTVESSNVTQNIGAAAGGDVIYAAECKVVQRAHPPAPHYALPKMDLQIDDKREKRKSFNMAAKGFGTYNDFYKPIHLGKAC